MVNRLALSGLFNIAVGVQNGCEYVKEKNGNDLTNTLRSVNVFSHNHTGRVSTRPLEQKGAEPFLIAVTAGVFRRS